VARVFQEDKPFSHAVRAARTSHITARLSAGESLGVTKGSIYKLFGSDQVPWAASDTQMATARVVEVSENGADLAVSDGRPLTADELWAVETEYALPEAEVKLHVSAEIRANQFHDQAIAKAVAQLPFVSLQEDAASAQVILSPIGSDFRLSTADSRPVGGPFPAAGVSRVADALAQRLLAYARWQRLYRWGKRTTLRPDLDLTMEHTSAGVTRTLRGADLIGASIPAGSRLRLLVKNINTRALRVDALLLRPDFGVDVCKIARIESGQQLATEPVGLGALAGEAAWKLIVSADGPDIDLNFMRSMPATRGVAASVLGELRSLLWEARPEATRGAAAELFWSTHDLRFKTAAMAASVPVTFSGCVGVPAK
jgi:hypothetical protein